MARPSAFNTESPQQPGRQLQLVVHAGPLAGKGYPLTKDALTFGREPDNDITLDDTQVSRYHARLLLQDDQVIVEDLGSTNGTMVNGDRISGQHVLQPADIIGIGSSVFGVKGFAAASTGTAGVTQVSPDPITYTPAQPGVSVPASSPQSPAQPKPRPASAPAPRPIPRPTPPSGSSRLTVLAMGGIVALIIIIVLIGLLTAYFLNQGGSSVAEPPTVVITAPTADSQFQTDTAVTVQATGSASVGVVRMELWVRGVKTNEAVSPASAGQPTLTASFQWTPEAPGAYTLEIRAYTAQGLVNTPTSVTINVVGDEAIASDETPTVTPTPEPIETVPGNPSLTTRTDLNVRGGPGIAYDLLGLLPTGTEAEIIGRDSTRQWWQVRFDPAVDGRGWVSADSAFSEALNVENVPVVQPPPTPTGTPTATSVPPTDTPTATLPPPTSTPTATESAPTDTPEPTSTPTAEPGTIDFEVFPTSIQGGDCVTVSWDVTGVREIYIDGLPVAGTGALQDCPNENTTYRLRVIKLDGTEQTEEIQVEVTNPVSIKSSGLIEIEPNETIDIDDGDIPGDDFIWSIDDDERRFEIQEDVQIAVMNNTNSLDELSRSDCLNANYGVYTFIDASNRAPDPNNTLIAGRTICFRTNKNRIGKLRFPDYSADDLDIEWVTWQE